VALAGRIDCAKGFMALAVIWMGEVINRDDTTALMYGDKSARYPGDWYKEDFTNLCPLHMTSDDI